MKVKAAEIYSLELNSVLKPGDSISLLSGNHIFAAGFKPTDAPGAYAFGIWYAAIPDNSTVVWLANRDHLVDTNSSMALTQGNMVISTSDVTIVWATNTSDKGVKKAVLQENGSLALLSASSGGSSVWQSFDHPTDTLLPMQRFLRDVALVSKKSVNSHSSGDYKLSFNRDNRLSLTYTGEAVAAPAEYWVDLDSMDQSQQYAVTGGGGELIIANASMNTTGGIIISDGIVFMPSNFGEANLRKLTLGGDGNLRDYSWNQSSSRWIVVWRAIQQQCKIYSMCGPNALCVDKLDDTYICICPVGFHAKNSTDRSLVLRCEPNIVLINCTSTHVQNYTSYYKFISLEFVNYQGHDLLPLSSVTLKQCETVCRQNCSCVGFYYKYSQVSWRALEYL